MARKPKAEEPTPEPVDEQCTATDDDGNRCLFVVHDAGDHAFTEEDATAAEAPGEADEAAGATDTDPISDAAPEAPGEAPEANTPDPLPPLRVAENSWWCGKPGCDTSMGHDVSVCSACHTPRG